MGARETFPSLTGLRFVLAAWITVYHLLHSYGPIAAAEHPLIAAGNARVDIFFVLSGFVLAHVYAVRDAAKAKRFDFLQFLVARAARLYPLHLLALAVLGAAVLAAHLVGKGEEVAGYTGLGLLANLFMLQATNIAGSGGWNFPAWTLSAEAFGYLLFPIFIAMGAALRARPLALLALALVIVVALGAAWTGLGMGPLSEATQVFGIIRGAACMLVGVGARYAFDDLSLDRAQAGALAIAGGLIAAASAMLGLDLALVAMGAGALIIGLAGLDRGGVVTALAGPTLVRLGHWSFALFILHMPVFIITWRVLDAIGWAGELDWRNGLIMLGLAMAVSWPAHALVEEPAREKIRKAFSRKPRAEPAISLPAQSP